MCCSEQSTEHRAQVRARPEVGGRAGAAAGVRAPGVPAPAGGTWRAEHGDCGRAASPQTAGGSGDRRVPSRPATWRRPGARGAAAQPPTSKPLPVSPRHTSGAQCPGPRSLPSQGLPVSSHPVSLSDSSEGVSPQHRAGAPETQLEMLSPTAATDKARSTHRSLADAP